VYERHIQANAIDFANHIIEKVYMCNTIAVVRSHLEPQFSGSLDSISRLWQSNKVIFAIDVKAPWGRRFFSNVSEFVKEFYVSFRLRIARS
jgi:hypothetical protein